MTTPLLPRELCRFRIEMDEIRISERRMENADVKDFIQNSWSRYFTHTPDAENEIQWFAEIGPTEAIATLPLSKAEVDVTVYRTIAYAFLHGTGEEAEFSMIVDKDYRSQGLGTVMLRMATDLAIRHHKKVITVEIPDGALRSTNTFGREGFDFSKDGSSQIGRKEIR